MSAKKEAWGIEVGAQAIKAVKLVRTNSGVALEDFDVMPFKNVLTTPDLNVEEVIRVNLEELSQKHQFNTSSTNVVVSVPGHMAFARFAKLPPIESKQVKSIVAYEAQQQIPFPIEEVEWDYHVFEEEDAPDIEVGIFAITKEKVAHFLSNYRAVGVKVDALTLSPIAVYNAFAYENEDAGGHGEGTVYLDIGSVSTDIIVVEDGGIWLRTLPLGGNHFTQALMKQFKISFAKAEKLKLEAGTSKYAKQIFQAMRGVFSDLVTEVQRSLGFYTSLNRDAELKRIVGVGSTWKLPGLQKYLKQNLQMKVIRPDGYSRLEVEDRRAAEFSSAAVNMATAYGLALQGLGASEVDANILPQSILRQRMMKAKQPWIGAAAACVVAAAAIAPAVQFMKNSSFKSAWSTESPKLNATLSKAEAAKRNYDQVQTEDPRPGIRNYRRSFDYTNLYPKLYEDIAKAMATVRPDDAPGDINFNDPESVKKFATMDRRKRDLVWVSEVVTQYSPPLALAPEIELDGEGVPPPPTSSPSSSFRGNTQPLEAGLLLRDSGKQPTLKPVPFPGTAIIPVASPDDPNSSGQPQQAQPGTPAKKTPEQLAKELENAPRIVVTVIGETTMDVDTFATLVKQKFVAWMQENANRADRPYVLMPNKFAIPSIQRRSELLGTGATFGDTTGSNDGLSKTPRPKTPKSDSGGTGGFRPGTGLGTGGSRDSTETPEVVTPEGWYASLTADTGFTIPALLPKRQLSKEEKGSDTVFTMKFEIAILSPDKARKSILPQENTTPNPAEPTTGTEARVSGSESEDQS